MILKLHFFPFFIWNWERLGRLHYEVEDEKPHNNWKCFYFLSFVRLTSAEAENDVGIMESKWRMHRRVVIISCAMHKTKEPESTSFLNLWGRCVAPRLRVQRARRLVITHLQVTRGQARTAHTCARARTPRLAYCPPPEQSIVNHIR